MSNAKVYTCTISESTNYKVIALSPRSSILKMKRFLHVKLGMPSPYYYVNWWPQFNKGMVTINYETFCT